VHTELRQLEKQQHPAITGRPFLHAAMQQSRAVINSLIEVAARLSVAVDET
jgi:hypothetical protein